MRPRQRRIQALPAGINRQMQPTGLRQMPPPKVTRPPRRVLPAMAPWLSTKPPKPMARRRLKEQRLLMERSPGKPPRAHPDKKPPAVMAPRPPKGPPVIAPAETAGAAIARQQSSAAPRDAQTDTHAAAGQPPAQHDTSTTHTMPTTINTTAVHKPMPKGVAFVEAAIKPLDFELEERWWGWRPNDIIDLTDNVNNFQMGVLEVTRRTTVALAERISRTGTTDAFDENLEQAMNWFMIKASSYWFPSAESKYRDGLEEMQVYLEKLKAGNATFYTRTDNLIPLLSSFEDLLGSCDENLVKQTNDDGTPISSFAVDNYFYYTQGVASAMATVLEAVHHDFLLTLESRNATELLHHAIISCQQATEIEPWIILDRNWTAFSPTTGPIWRPPSATPGFTWGS
jgi:hypothetical protein